MGVAGQAVGLRDRKKIKTRDAIRRAAMRLIEKNGYANTTVEDIAETAEVAPSTFFRYFPSKDAVLLADDLERVALEALAQQPPELSPLRAFRAALAVVAAKVSESEWAFERARQRVVFSTPELKAAQFDSYRRASMLLAETEERRRGRRLDDVDAAVFYGAIVGALMAVIDRGHGSVENDLFRALDFIEAGMPLS